MDPRGQRKIKTSQYVVDASVVAKWVLPIEPYQENALKLKDDYVSKRAELYAPAVLTIEVTNVLWKAVKLKRLSQEDAQEALKTLGNINLGLHELDWAEASQILNTGCRLDCAIYDSTYLFLADKIKAQFVTSDNKLYEKSKGHFKVLHIKDYGTNVP
jgi:predicted nucleic acid-binding protein